jgi:hypothetical protein
MRMKIVREQLLTTLRRNTRRHQKAKKAMRMTGPCVNE